MQKLKCLVRSRRDKKEPQQSFVVHHQLASSGSEPCMPQFDIPQQIPRSASHPVLPNLAFDHIEGSFNNIPHLRPPSSSRTHHVSSASQPMSTVHSASSHNTAIVTRHPTPIQWPFADQPGDIHDSGHVYTEQEYIFGGKPIGDAYQFPDVQLFSARTRQGHHMIAPVTHSARASIIDPESRGPSRRASREFERTTSSRPATPSMHYEHHAVVDPALHPPHGANLHVTSHHSQSSLHTPSAQRPMGPRAFGSRPHNPHTNSGNSQHSS